MNKNKFSEDIKSVATISSFIAMSSVVVAYILRRLQFVLYGLPPELSLAQLSYVNIVFGLLLTITFSALLVGSPLLYISSFIARNYHPRWKRLSRPSGGSIGLAFVATLFVLFLPAQGVSGLCGLLWRTDDPEIQMSGMLPLVLSEGCAASLARYVTSGLALCAMAQVLLLVISTVADWRRNHDPKPTIKLAAASLICLVAIPSYLALLAALLPGIGESAPQVTILLRSSVLSAGAAVEGFLISEETNVVYAFPAAKGAASVVLLPKESIARIDFQGKGEPVKRLLYRRLTANMTKMEGKTMAIETYDAKRAVVTIPFVLWATIGALMVVVGFWLWLPGAAQADSSSTTKQPDVPVHDGKVRAAAVLTPDFLAPVLAYYPAVENMAGNVAQMVEMFVGMFMRGGEETAGDLWLQGTDGGPRRLTVDGGYTAPCPSQDGTKVAFLHHGRPGIYDLLTGETRLLPGDAIYDRLFGWEQNTGDLLALQKGKTLVRLHMADGQVAAMPAAHPTDNELAALDVLTRMTPSPGVLLVSNYNNEWSVLEKRWGIPDNRELFTINHPLSYPTWSKVGLFYISNQD